MPSVRPVIAIALGVLICGCRPHASPQAPNASAAIAGGNTCHATRGDTRPLLVEWPAADRAQLEAASAGGLVAVRYDGCQMQVLSRCELEGGYDYHPITRKRDELRIRSRDALWAEIPLGAASLESALSREGQINVDMAVVGQRQANVDQARATGSGAACSGATHVVTTMTVGAFTLYTGNAIEGSVDVTLHGAGGGGQVARSSETLRSDGDLARCSDATTHDDAPPTQCGALLRVELAPLGAGGALVSDDEARRAQDAAVLRKRSEQWRGAQRGARIGAGLSAAGALGGLVFVVVRSVQISSAEFDRDREARTADEDDPFFASADERARAEQRVEELEADIDRYETSRRTAGFVSLGLAVGAAGLVGLAVGARNRSHTLGRRANALSVAPMGGPGLGGVSFSGRF